MSTAKLLRPVAERRGLVRLDNDEVVTLLGVRGNRARIRFAPGPEHPNGDGHRRTVPITTIMEVVE